MDIPRSAVRELSPIGFDLLLGLRRHLYAAHHGIGAQITDVDEQRSMLNRFLGEVR
jgi:hypothetical protein